MVKRYYGGLISATQAVANSTSASGLFNASQQMQAKQAGDWPPGPALPGAPTIGTATAGQASASVTFTAPIDPGFPATITSYTVTSSPGGLTGTGATSPVTVSGLTNGTAYTFTVTATNATGTGPASAASNSVTPVASPTYLIGSTTALSPPATGKTISSYDIVADSFLNYYVASVLDQGGGSSNGPQLIKYDKDGVIQWQKALFDSSGTGYTVAIDSSNNVYIGGNIAAGDYNRMVLLKYNSSGTLQLQKTYRVGTMYNSQIRKITIDSSGNIYCAVNSNNNTSGSNDNGYVVKLDSTGAVTWVKGLGTLNTNIGTVNMFGIGVDSSSNVYVHGLFQPSSNQAVVAQLSSAGTFNWRVGTANTGSPTRYFYTQAGVTDSSGNSVIAGATNTTSSIQQSALIKYNSSGVITWQNRYGDATNSSIFYAVALDGSGNVYATGYTINSGKAAMVVVKINSSGTYQWHRTLSNTSNDVVGYGIYASSGGTVYATGYVGDNPTRFDGVVMVFDTDGNTSNSGAYALNGIALTLGALQSFFGTAAGLTANTNNVGFFTPTVNVVTNIGTDTTTSSVAQIAVLGTTTALTQKAIFVYGSTGTVSSITNLVSNTGVVATDVTAVGTARYGMGAATYGGDKAIVGYGYNNITFPQLSNLISNTGVVAADTSIVGTARYQSAAAGYGTDKAIFGYGQDSVGTTVSMTNLVSNTGVVATDTTGVGSARYNLAAAGYGTDKAIFGFGTDGTATATTNLVSNTGVVAANTTGVGTGRRFLAAAGYGTDKAIFGYGTNDAGTIVSMTNKVSNTGVVATDTTGVGTARQGLAAAIYGGDKAIFGYGGTPTITSITNLVSNTGVVAANTTGVGTARNSLSAAGYSST